MRKYSRRRRFVVSISLGILCMLNVRQLSAEEGLSTEVTEPNIVANEPNSQGEEAEATNSKEPAVTELPSAEKKATDAIASIESNESKTLKNSVDDAVKMEENIATAEPIADDNVPVSDVVSEISVLEGIIQEADGVFYYINNIKQYDVVVETNQKSYYFEPESWSGIQARNKWSYSPSKQSWYYSQSDGHITQRVEPQGYYIDGLRQYDKVADIVGYRQYYYEPQEWKGPQARNKWSYSPSKQSWYYSRSDGHITQRVEPQGYYIDGLRQYDKVADIVGYRQYYYEPQEWGGPQARNKWSYSPSKQSWYYSQSDGHITQRVEPQGYYIDGLRQYDKVADIVGYRQYYYEPQEWKGPQARNKWSYSPSKQSWYYSRSDGHITQRVEPQGYYIDGLRQYDKVADIVGYRQYYYEPQEWGGPQARNKWSYSPSKQSWYYSRSDGHITQRVEPQGYYIDGLRQYDAIVPINTVQLYYGDTHLKGVQIFNDNIYSKKLNQWVTVDAKGHVTKVMEKLTGINPHVQAVLNKYNNGNYHILYESLAEDDARTASVLADTATYGASVPKIVVVAYVQDRIERGLMSWNDQIDFNTYYALIQAGGELYYASGGSGSIEYEPNRWGKKYTVQDVVNRVLKQSDNLGTNLLLAYTAGRDRSDFNNFTMTLLGRTYSRTLTPREINNTMKKLYAQTEQFAVKAMDRTNYDGTKIDVLPVNVSQKIGEWSVYNHSTAFVWDKNPFILTILTNGKNYTISASTISRITKEIYAAHLK